MSGWQPVETAPEKRKMLVTNNLHSRDAFGDMSHLWVVGMVHKPTSKRDPEGWSAFDGFSKIIGLTHWAPYPMPDPPA